MIKHRLIRTAALAAMALIFSAAFTYFQVNAEFEKSENALLPVTSDTFGGPFSLTDHTGETFTDKDLLGQYQLIYFGFTYCPAICPTELQKMTSALNILEEKADQIQPVFITVDPERDTAEVMKTYISSFHPRFIGLTGTAEATEQIKRGYKVYAAKVDDPAFTEYTVDHSSFIYFISPEGQLLHIFKIEDSAQYLADTMSKWLDQGA